MKVVRYAMKVVRYVLFFLTAMILPAWVDLIWKDFDDGESADKVLRR